MPIEENDIVETANHSKYAVESAPTGDGRVLYSITRLARGGEIEIGKLTVGPDNSPEPKDGVVSVYFGEGDLDSRHERTSVPMVGESMYLVNRKLIDPAEMGEDGEQLYFHYSLAPAHLQRFSLSKDSKEQRRAAAMVAAIVRHYLAREDLEAIHAAASAKRDAERLKVARLKEKEIQRKIAGLNLELADVTEEITVLELLVPEDIQPDPE